jgi:hypothetical protein
LADRGYFVRLDRDGRLGLWWDPQDTENTAKENQSATQEHLEELRADITTSHGFEGLTRAGSRIVEPSASTWLGFDGPQLKTEGNPTV